MPYLSMVFTAKFVAKKLGVEQAVIDELARPCDPRTATCR